jgi:ferritin-like metal-binding protein YciE
MSRTREEALSSYLTDMLALEDHLENAIQGQITDFKDEHPEVVPHLEVIHGNTQRHIAALKALVESRGGNTGMTGIAEAVKRAGSTVAGLGAAVIDMLRSEKLPKDLRDDYAAVSLAAIGYVMLLTTARALDDAPVAEVARQHLRNYARSVMELTQIIPEAVVKFLQQDGLSARGDVVHEVVQTVVEAWQSQAPEDAATESNSQRRTATRPVGSRA